jgi:hypothetical protein
MAMRRVFILAGSLWEIVRFFLVLSILALLFRGAAGQGSWILPWLLLGGTGNLLVAVGGIMLALFPLRYEGVMSLLRLGKALGIFSFLLLLASGAVGMTPNVVLARVAPLVVTEGSALIAIVVFDLLFLAALLFYRTGSGRGGLPADRVSVAPPQYTETEAGNFH